MCPLVCRINLSLGTQYHQILTQHNALGPSHPPSSHPPISQPDPGLGQNSEQTLHNLFNYQDLCDLSEI